MHRKSDDTDAVSQARVAGVDVWKGKWLAVVLRGRIYEDARLRTRIGDVLADVGDVGAVGIDMPIGLTSGEERRHADEAARAFVGPRRSSVFPTYPREVYAAPTYDAACEESIRLVGVSISRQAYGLGERLLELEQAVVGRADVWEVHPEVSFRGMAGDHLRWPKASWNGFYERLELLRREGVEIPPAVESLHHVGSEDVLDAAAAAWTAARIAEGTAASLPSEPTQFAGDRPLAIWY
jgi:predicted RNase H-like nuclease